MSKPLPKSLWVEPSEEDEIVGDTCSPTKCMISMCLRRMFPQASWVSVNPNRVTITVDGIYHHYVLPTKALPLILDFDDKKHAEIKKKGIMLTLVDKRRSSYVASPETKERHRLSSATRRADPDYVRPDRGTIRAKMAQARRNKRKADRRKQAYVEFSTNE